MKRIFWAIQQLDRIGGTEMVSIQLMNKLANDYEIVLLSIAANPKPYVYEVDPRIKIVSLGLPPKLARYDQQYSHLKRHPFRRIALLHSLIRHYWWKRNIYRDQIAKMMDREDDVFIASSLDSYWLAPRKKNKRYILHYHFDEKEFLRGIFQFALLHSRKPDEYVFLSKSCLDAVSKKKPKIAKKSIYIHNPIRFAREYSEPPFTGSLLFVGHYRGRKDPFFALSIMKELKDMGKPYHLDMYGDGYRRDEMFFYKDEYSLDNVTIHEGTPLSKEDFQKHDLFLLTSTLEGFCLAKGEASVNSLPTISTRWSGPIDEVFVEGKDSFVIEPRDPKLFAKKIDEILSDKEKELSLRKSTYDASEIFDDDSIIEKWKTLLG